MANLFRAIFKNIFFAGWRVLFQHKDSDDIIQDTASEVGPSKTLEEIYKEKRRIPPVEEKPAKSLNVLLINSNRFKQPWPVMPYGLLCVAAACNKAGHNVKVLDLCFSKDTVKDISNAIASFRPEVIGITIRNIDNGAGYNTSFLLDDVKKDVINPVKSQFRGPIIIGGPSVGINSKEMLDFFDLEYAVKGDGESCITEFLNRVSRNKPLSGLQGLVIRSKDGTTIQDPAPYRVADINTLSYPDPAKYLNLKNYRKFDSPLQIQSKRGCVLKCTYCTYNNIEGHSCRLKDPKIVANEIERLVKDTGINHIEFTDSVFNIPLNHTKDVLREIIKKNLKLRLRTLGLNPGAVDTELVDLMKRAGMHDVDLGIESASDITLKSLGKNYVKEDVIRAGKLLHDRGISINWYLLVGAPGETKETLDETITTVAEIASKWDLINFGIGIRAYNGAPLSEDLKKTNPELSKSNFLYPVKFEPKDITLDKVKQMVKAASFKYPNIFMYDEDETTPLFLQKLGTIIMKLFAPRAPIWKLFILNRYIEHALGIRKVRYSLWKDSLAKRPLDLEVMEEEEGESYDNIPGFYKYVLDMPVVNRVLQISKKIDKKGNEPLKILDIGCGTGRISIGIAKKITNAKLYALDVSSGMLKVAGENIKKEGLESRITLYKGNAKKIPFDNKFFDIVVCSGMLHHLDNPVYVLNEVNRLVDDGGAMVIRDPIRPPSRSIANLLVGVFGIFEDKVLRKGYLDSLLTSFKTGEFKELVKESDIKEADFSFSFPHFIFVTKIRKMPAAPRISRVSPLGSLRLFLTKCVYNILKLVLTSTVKITIEGRENIPGHLPEAVIVSNHSSYLDVPVMGVAFFDNLIDLSWVVSKSNYDIWFLKWLWMLFKPIVTGGGTIQKIKNDLKSNRWAVIFPEGNEKWCPPSEAKKKLEKPSSGAAVVALSTGVTIIPVGITGADKVLPARSFKLDTRYHVTIRIGKPFSYDKVKDESISPDMLNEAREEIMNRIYSLVDYQTKEPQTSRAHLSVPYNVDSYEHLGNKIDESVSHELNKITYKIKKAVAVVIANAVAFNVIALLFYQLFHKVYSPATAVLNILAASIFVIGYSFLHKAIPGKGITKGLIFGTFLWLIEITAAPFLIQSAISDLTGYLAMGIITAAIYHNDNHFVK